MSQRYYNNINLQQNQLENAVIQNLASDPTSGKEGQIYYNTVDKSYRYHNGTAWVSINPEGIADVLAGVGLTRSISDSTITIGLGTPSASGDGTNTFGSNGVSGQTHTHQVKIPDASATQKGVIELATDAEATAGTDTVRAINAKQLAAAKQAAIDEAKVTVTAGKGLTGGGTGNSITVSMGTPSDITQSSTNSTTTESHTHKIVFTEVGSPEASGNELSFIDTVSQDATGKLAATKKTIYTASTTQKGVVELATKAEVDAATDTTKVVTPATLLKGKANGVASLDTNGKVISSQLPDYILGQMLWGGNATTVSTSATISISGQLKSKLGITADTITIVNNATSSATNTYGYGQLEGAYFICQTNGTFAGISYLVGDWIVSLGTKWDKIDNTDAVTGVKGNKENTYRIGNVNLTPANIGALAEDGTAANASKVEHSLTIKSTNGSNTAVNTAYNGSADVSVEFASADFVNTSGVIGIKNSGVTAGTYNTITTDAKGRVTGGSNVAYLQKSKTTITGTGTKTVFDIVHTLGADVTVQVFLTGQSVGTDTVDELVMVDTYTMNNKVKLVFGTAPTTTEIFKVIITG